MADKSHIRRTSERGFLITLLVLITAICLYLIAPFFGAIVWAVVAAVLFQPIYTRLNQRLAGRSNWAASLTLILFLLLVIVPAILLGTALIGEASDAYDQLQAGEFDFGAMLTDIEKALPRWAQRQLSVYGFDDIDALRQRIEETLANSLEFLISQAFNVGQSVFRFFLTLGVMLYLTFYLLRDGRSLIGKIADVIPLAAANRVILADKFIVVIRATIKGTFVVAMIQGALGGLIFWLLDIPGALLWGVIMAAFSLVPAIGTAFIWAPVAVYLLATGSFWQALILFICGTFIIGLVDNILRPILVGRDTRLPDYVVLISTLGGLSLFGFNGIVIGPLLAALFIALWGLFAEMNGQANTAASE